MSQEDKQAHNDVSSERLIREELFSMDRLEQHAKSLALAQKVTTKPQNTQSLVKRLKNNGSVLASTYNIVAAATSEGEVITPAAEWLLDNYYIVEEQIREIYDHLPAGYYLQLPKLAEGHLAGYPRVFGMAWAFVAHTDSLFDPEMLKRFTRAYQEIQPLTIGELWAIAITLRIVLVENLRRASVDIVRERYERREADILADQLLNVHEYKTEKSIASIFQKYSQITLPSAFAVQLIQRFRGADPQITSAFIWLEKHLAEHDLQADQLVCDEHQKQCAANVTVRNIITSMRLISNFDWADFFESISLIDESLRTNSNFANMDFPTRNLYRSAIEELSRGSKMTEGQIACLAIEEANNCLTANESGLSQREQDPGYYLIAGGRLLFESKIGFKVPIFKRFGRLISSSGIGSYVGLVLMATTIILSVPLFILSGANISLLGLLVLAILGLAPAMDAAIALVNQAVMRLFNATILPSLELSNGIPAQCRTMIVVPTLLVSKSSIEEQVKQLEIYYLASTEDNLHFALLTDWQDSATEHAENDDELFQVATQNIELLNQHYGRANDGTNRFFLLHRPRAWNEKQNQWMGWERKRGKLHVLNKWLRDSTSSSFMPLNGIIPTAPPNIRYVITLDADTKLPLEATLRLIGKIAHPLNHPKFDNLTGRVIEGYAILQPRVTTSLPMNQEGSLFQQIFSRFNGLDPYAEAVSDVYQDLFEEGSYTGKGIYDVDAFELALANRVPENTLLSHDLFEGIFARAGLVSDIEVVEEFPPRYDVYGARQHRWARGDWQLVPWIMDWFRSLGKHNAATIPAIGMWKMLDNLRRTLSAPASTIALLIGWTFPFHEALVWTSFIVLIIILPTLIPILAGILPSHGRITTGSYFRALAKDLWIAVCQTVLLITFLPHQAWLMGDAIVRTLFRLFISHQYLLEWVTAAQMKVSAHLDVRGFYKQMSGSVVISFAVLLLAWKTENENWQLILPFALLWLLAPAIACWTSLLPKVSNHLLLPDLERENLRQIARRTWRFFETFVTAQENMLPPDNFQEDTKPEDGKSVIAHRTSPTNIGLYLLSAISARDFGWAGTVETVNQLESTLATMMKLQRFKGHFYNWYDTRDLRPLEPQYISSVDSGNLAGHLITVSNTCHQWAESFLLQGNFKIKPSSELFRGIRDNLNLTREALQKLPNNRYPQTIKQNELENTINEINAILEQESKLPLQNNVAISLVQLLKCSKTLVDIAKTLANDKRDVFSNEVLFWAEATCKSVENHLDDITQTPAAVQFLYERLLAIEVSTRSMVENMEFGFLLDPQRKLLSIGFLINENRLDHSCYDLLASEARLASFIAIAKGDIPTKHWFRLGRPITTVQSGAALLSWSGSMFEYLMPSLVMRAPTDSLIEQSNRLVVARQISYGISIGTPWGISESAYNTRDLEFTYQYSNFGVPGLGLKRGLRNNIVIAPYATALASMINPTVAAKNFTKLTELKALGKYGFYESLDYTPSRLPEGEQFATVYAFMAHHQGMTIVALSNTLLGGLMRSRFHAEPIIQATELLLQERAPRDIAVSYPRAEEVEAVTMVENLAPPTGRRFYSADSSTPITHLLSNGRYTVMLTNAASGYSQWNNLAVTRWQEDVTRDNWGTYIFLRDLQSGDVWSAGYQPTGVEPRHYEVIFNEDHAEFIRFDGLLKTSLEVIVSPEEDAEVRRVSVLNTGDHSRKIEITSYCELALATFNADKAHPAFSKLFIQTEYLPKTRAIVATRRRREMSEPEVWVAHLAVVEGETIGDLEIETDRARFLGRGRGARNPIVMMDVKPLSNTVGIVLDPIFAIRQSLLVPPGGVARIAFWTVVASSRQELLDLIDKHHQVNAFERAATLAWTQVQVQMHHLKIDLAEAYLYQALGGHILYANPRLRPVSEILRLGAGEQSALWNESISGDIPIVLVRIDDLEDIEIVRQLLRAHEYLQMKKLAFDLVILNGITSSYIQDLQVALETIVRTSQSKTLTNDDQSPLSVFVLRADLVPTKTQALIASVARVVLDAHRGTLSEQLNRLREPKSIEFHQKRQKPFRVKESLNLRTIVDTAKLEFFNGLGGFAENGKEYVTILGTGQSLPAPWINVIANSQFGFQVGVEGSGYTWSLNSRENQLTPWSNDPVTDSPGEAFYIRDEETGELWSPTARPIRDESSTYVTRHGQGYSRFEHTANNISLNLLQYVPLADSIKISRLKIKNLSGHTRHLSLTAYVEWVLGTVRSTTAPYIITDIDSETGALIARNPWNSSFKGRVAFMDLAGQQSAWTGDRREFIGRNATLNYPAGLMRKNPLSKRLGAGLDPCGVLQSSFKLKPNETIEIVCFLGEAENLAVAQSLIARYREANLDETFEEVIKYWDDFLGKVQVKTPDKSMDIMLNRWMLYQTLVCRIWARAAFYQASGAYGFRDQLQDGMALAISAPEITREHLLRAAGRQFIEGDFQHWWMPQGGQGVRTRISDDRIWLAYVTAHYIAVTGDLAVLDEQIPFLEGAILQPGEHDAYFQPKVSDNCASLFEHCALGLDKSLNIGVHGLPLIGAGDWNDGMNRVGEQGKGESIWLAWFLHKTLSLFRPLATLRNEKERAVEWLKHANKLKKALEQEGWDGDWYLRGYFDDGTPLGSSLSDECKIDSIAQSWSVISGAADLARASHAMAAVEKHLIHRQDGQALLFTPPFSKTDLEPGYIKSYPLGIRENGGQYTHAAAWSIIAFASLRQGDKAANLFSLLNPINHTSTRAAVYRYKVEPYVVAADVYSVFPHTGRGGWTWYTGAAGWLYRAGLESILGFYLQGNFLLLKPCIPKQWSQFEIVFKYHSTIYEIFVENPHRVSSGIVSIKLDGHFLETNSFQIPLFDDKNLHKVHVLMGGLAEN